MHWADEATLDVLRIVARRVETLPALIVATYRDDELDRRHPLRRALGELTHGDRTTRLAVEPLSPEAVAALAAPHGVDADDLYRKTNGNAFFVTEVLAADGAEVPETARDAVLARAARLSPEATELLEAVAVVPPHAEQGLLEAIVPDGVDDSRNASPPACCSPTAETSSSATSSRGWRSRARSRRTAGPS